LVKQPGHQHWLDSAALENSLRDSAAPVPSRPWLIRCALAPTEPSSSRRVTDYQAGTHIACSYLQNAGETIGRFGTGVAFSSRVTARTALICCALLLSSTTELSPSQPGVQLEMRNVRLHVSDGIVLDISRLRGVMISRQPERPPLFDDQRSYTLHLQSAEISMDMASLQNLMNRHVFAYQGAPLKDLTVAPDGARLKMKGKLHKAIDVPFSTITTVSPTTNGLMRLHVESMKAAGIPAKGLLDLFGLKLDDVMDIKNRRGVDVQDNDILIAAGQVLPPPEIVGRLTRVSVQGQRLVQTFEDTSKGRPTRLAKPSAGARNYIYFAGGNITFGKLTMHDADLQLIDMDPRDPFDFFPARYNAQLVAGYSKNTPSKGLKTYMPDFDDLKKTGR